MLNLCIHFPLCTCRNCVFVIYVKLSREIVKNMPLNAFSTLLSHLPTATILCADLFKERSLHVYLRWSGSRIIITAARVSF